METLEISVDKYFKSKGKNPADYEFIPLRVESCEGYTSRESVKNVLISRAKNANCEVIVDLHYDHVSETSGTIFSLDIRTKYMAYGIGLKLKDP